MRMAVFLPDRALPLPHVTCSRLSPFSGNPLAIVEQADGLSTAQMQIIAREFNLSETIFVQRPDDPRHSAKVRIFFPTAELPFAGHPTIGCALHLAMKDAPEGDFTRDLVLEEQAGLVPVRVWRRDGVARAEFSAPVIPHAATEGQTPDTELLARALDLAPNQIGFDAHAPGVWEGGPRFLYVPARDLQALAAARPIEPAWSELMACAAVDNAYLYTPGAQSDYRARMFPPPPGSPKTRRQARPRPFLRRNCRPAAR